MHQTLFIKSEQTLKSMEGFSIEKLYSILENKIMSWVEGGVELLPNFVIALAVMALFILASKIVKKISFKLLDSATDNIAIQKLLSNLFSMAVMIIGLLVSLEILSLSKAVTSMLAGAGVVGIAIGFAFQESSANFISGFFIAFHKPYKVGDVIETESIMGTVDSINMHATVLKTFDGQEVLVPNRTVFSNPIWNYTVTGQRRIVLEVGVSYDENLEQVEKMAKMALENVQDRDKEMPLEFFYKKLGESSIDFQIQYWISMKNGGSYLGSRHDAIKKIKSIFDKEGIHIPFPIRTLDISKGVLESMQDKKSSLDS